MVKTLLTAEDLLAGAEAVFEVVIPEGMLPAAKGGEAVVQIRPLSIGAFQLILKAAKNDAALIPLLMIKEALAEPALGVDQVKRLPLGLVDLLVDNIREISGLTQKKSP
jgi:hypothetical protein